jgi:hypothetical protein
MVLEFECFLTLRTLELPQNSTFVMAYHVALQTVHVRECLVTHFAGLSTKTNTDIQMTQFATSVGKTHKLTQFEGLLTKTSSVHRA